MFLWLFSAVFGFCVCCCWFSFGVVFVFVRLFWFCDVFLFPSGLFLGFPVVCFGFPLGVAFGFSLPLEVFLYFLWFCSRFSFGCVSVFALVVFLVFQWFCFLFSFGIVFGFSLVLFLFPLVFFV